jgi:hypothetical protein
MATFHFEGATLRTYLDIETLPSLAPDARILARAGVKPPGNYKKAESIAEWWKTEGEAAIEEAYRKGALDGATGELCAVGFAGDDGEPASLVRGLGEPEGDFLRRALAELRALADADSVTGADGTPWPVQEYFIAHNASFDLGFLLRRCWALGIKPPVKLPLPSARPGRDYGCTMELWAGSRGTIGLDRLCRALGVPSPKADGMDGSQVFDLWQSGEHERIATYNAADVRAVRACWHRLQWEAAA